MRKLINKKNYVVTTFTAITSPVIKLGVLIIIQTVRSTPLTLRLLMSYIYGAPILDVSRSHTTTQHSR